MAWLKGSQTQALSLFENALAAFSSSDEAANNLFELKAMIQGNPSVAELQQIAEWNKERAGFEGQLGVKAALAEYLYHLGRTAVRQGQLIRAHAALRESVALCRDARDYRGAVTALIHLGRVLAAQDDHEHALMLYAAAATVADADSLDPWPPVNESDYHVNVETSRAALGVDLSDRIWRDGLALSLNEAVTAVRALAKSAATPATRA